MNFEKVFNKREKFAIELRKSKKKIKIQEKRCLREAMTELSVIDNEIQDRVFGQRKLCEMD
jgi:hypothetical protein